MPYEELSNLLFHGSDVAVLRVDLSKSAPNKDFGKGFYTTSDSSQAERFARLKAERAGAGNGFVSVFRLLDSNDLRIKLFEAADKDWFEFVLLHRGYRELATTDADESCDIVIGPVADDAVGLVLNLFVAGVYGDPRSAESKDTAIRLLLTQRLHNQVFIGSELAVSRLFHVETYDVPVN